MLAKFRGFGNSEKEHNATDQQNGICDNTVSYGTMNDNCRSSEPSSSKGYSVHVQCRREIHYSRNSSDAAKSVHLNANACRNFSASDQSSPLESRGSIRLAKQTESLTRFVLLEEMDEMELEERNLDNPENKDEAQKEQNGKRFPSSGESSGSSGSSANKEDKESKALVDCEIRWDDLLLGEDIGQGKFQSGLTVLL